MTSKLINTTVCKDYKLVKKLGSGAFGEIFLGINKQNGEEYAVKVEDASTAVPQIMFEAKLYNYLNKMSSSGGETSSLSTNSGSSTDTTARSSIGSSDKGIPRVYFSGTDQGYNIMVMDLLGPSLEDLFVRMGRKFSLKTVLMLTDQILTRLEFMHSRNFLHRDIKSDNFLVGIGKKSHRIYLIDLGLAKRYVDKYGKHIPYKEGKSLTGTVRYASINTHVGLEQGRRDDLESLGYVIMYFLRGILPWQNLKATDKKDKYDRIMEKKMQTPVDVLCKGFPTEFATYLSYCKNLRFEDKPDYAHCRSLFKQVMQRNAFEYDHEWDWKSTQPDAKKHVKSIDSQPLVPLQPAKPQTTTQQNAMKQIVQTAFGGQQAKIRAMNSSHAHDEKQPNSNQQQYHQSGNRMSLQHPPPPMISSVPPINSNKHTRQATLENQNAKQSSAMTQRSFSNTGNATNYFNQAKQQSNNMIYGTTRAQQYNPATTMTRFNRQGVSTLPSYFTGPKITTTKATK